MEKKFTFAQRLRELLDCYNIRQTDLAARTGISKSSLSHYLKGDWEGKQDVIYKISSAYGISSAWLMGVDCPMTSDLPHGMESPTVTEDYVTFPVIGDLAAGFDHIMCEDWTGDKIDIPVSYLHGRPISDYFCLKVKGDSMYPLYMDGDRVLVLKAPTLQHSGDIGVVRYDGEMATLKKVEYADGEDWVRLVAINPNYPPHMITGCDLEQCSILGIPKLTLRET